MKCGIWTLDPYLSAGWRSQWKILSGSGINILRVFYCRFNAPAITRYVPQSLFILPFSRRNVLAKCVVNHKLLLWLEYVNIYRHDNFIFGRISIQWQHPYLKLHPRDSDGTESGSWSWGTVNRTHNIVMYRWECRRIILNWLSRRELKSTNPIWLLLSPAQFDRWNTIQSPSRRKSRRLHPNWLVEWISAKWKKLRRIILICW